MTSILINAADFEDFLYSISDNVGFAFLKTLPDAQSIALAGSGTAGYSSASSYLINPASAPYNMNRAISFSYINSFDMLNTGFINISYPLPIGYIFGGTGYSVSDTMQLRGDTPTSEPLGSFNFSALTMSIGYGLYVSNGIYWGASVRTISEYSYLLSKTSVVFNTGFLMTFESINGLTAGMSFLNLAPNYRYDLNSNDFIVSPFTVRAGLSYSKYIHKDLNITAYTDYIKQNDAEYKVSLAGQLSFRDIITISGGYIFNDITASYSAGLGVHIDKFTIQYTIKPYAYDLGFDNSLTIMMRI